MIGISCQNTLLFLILAFCISSSLPGQEVFSICGTVDYNNWLENKYPNQRSSEEAFEKWMLSKLNEQEIAHKREANDQVIRTIPVIFHIIYQSNQDIGQGVNISAEQVQSQIDVLNEDFRNEGNGYSTDPRGIDTKIEFCLSLIDRRDQLLEEPGVMRWSNWGDGYFDRGFVDNIIKPATSQDPTRFLNIWVVQLPPGLLGYAQFPDSSGLSGLDDDGGADDRDGVVIIPTVVGTTGLASGTLNMGRTASHEIGHWLGLRHIWGDGNCTKDDYCSDTPRCDGPYYSTAPSCLHPDQCGATRMIENYMDYSEGACMNIFTSQQKNRMDVVLTNSPNRPFSELVPTVCHPFELSTVSYTPKTVKSCGPMAIKFTNSLTEPANTSTNWSFNGITAIPAVSNQPIVTISAASSGILTAQVQTSYATITEQKSAEISVVILSASEAVCQAPSCSDGVRNGNETGIDCGGICGACNPECDKVAVYNGPIELPQTVKSAQLIEAGNLTGAGDINIAPEKNVSLQSNQVILQSGFNVSSNSELQIKIGGCN